MCDDLINKIFQGDALTVLKTFPDESIDCCISSPPYWGLRDYGTAKWEGGDINCNHKYLSGGITSVGLNCKRDKNGNKSEESKSGQTWKQYPHFCKKCGAKRIDDQLGLEPNFHEYIDKLCTIYDEVRRVLKKTGTCWVNLGDSYAGAGGMGSDVDNKAKKGMSIIKDYHRQNVKGVPNKCLVQIPSRFAIEMCNRGWILRNELIWYKPNCMPSSARDRFTVDFEKIYFFTKEKKYWFERQFEKEYTESTLKRWGHLIKSGDIEYGKTRKKVEPKQLERGRCEYMFSRMDKAYFNPQGRNKRCVWKIPTQSYPEAHFATFPEKLVETPIKAGCPEFVCTKCGKAREKVYDTKYVTTGNNRGKKNKMRAEGDLSVGHPSYDERKLRQDTFIGYTDCGCSADFKPGVVLDPFMGSGTVALVSRKLGRNYIGIELSPEYIKLAEKRLSQQYLNL